MEGVLFLISILLGTVIWLMPSVGMATEAEVEIPEPDLTLPEGYTITGDVVWQDMVILAQKNLTIGPTGHLKLVNSVLVIDLRQATTPGAFIVVCGRLELLSSEVKCVTCCALTEFSIHLKPGARLLAEGTRLGRCYLYSEGASAEIRAPSTSDVVFLDVAVEDTDLTLVSCRVLRFTARRSDVVIKGCELRRCLSAYSSDITMENTKSFRSDGWGLFLNSSTLVMRGCEVEKADWDGIVCYRSKAYIYNSTIKDNAHWYYEPLGRFKRWEEIKKLWRSAGIVCIDSELVVEGCWLLFNPLAIACEGPLTKAEIHWSAVLGAGKGCLKAGEDLAQPVNATLNWWDSPDGPGEGDVVGPVILKPWLVGPPPDEEPPTVEVIRPAEGEVLEEPSVLVEWEVSDDVAGVRKVELILDGGEPVDVTGLTSYTLTGLSEGKHILVLRAVDWAGRVAEVSRTFRVKSSMPTRQFNIAGTAIYLAIPASVVAAISLPLLLKRRH